MSGTHEPVSSPRLPEVLAESASHLREAAPPDVCPTAVRNAIAPICVGHLDRSSFPHRLLIVAGSHIVKSYPRKGFKPATRKLKTLIAIRNQGPAIGPPKLCGMIWTFRTHRPIAINSAWN